VNAIRIFGPRFTASSFLRTITQPITQATTVGQVIAASRIAAERMSRFDHVFSDIAFGLDSAVNLAALNSDARDDVLEVDVLVRVKEVKRMILRTGMEIGAGDSNGSMSASLDIRNVFGHAELLELSYAKGTKMRSMYRVAYTFPWNADPDKWIDVSAMRATRNYQLTRAHDQLVTGFMTRYKQQNETVENEVYYELAWRNVCDLPERASLSVRKEAGHSLKSAVGHVVSVDKRDSKVLPTQGYAVRVTNELSGGYLQGDVHTFKQEVETQWAASFGKDPRWAWSATLQGGWMAALGQQGIRLDDRFFLGGPSSVRGFRTDGVGPHDGRDSLGGNVHLAMGLSLYTPLPYFRTPAFRGHMFANAGIVRSIRSKDQLIRALMSPSISVGWGLVYAHPMARLEFNFCVPLLASFSDKPRPGFQMGIGVGFL
jgi:outer membrane protein insertion porin family